MHTGVINYARLYRLVREVVLHVFWVPLGREEDWGEGPIHQVRTVYVRTYYAAGSRVFTSTVGITMWLASVYIYVYTRGCMYLCTGGFLVSDWACVWIWYRCVWACVLRQRSVGLRSYSFQMGPNSAVGGGRK